MNRLYIFLQNSYKFVKVENKLLTIEEGKNMKN